MQTMRGRVAHIFYQSWSIFVLLCINIYRTYSDVKPVWWRKSKPYRGANNECSQCEAGGPKAAKVREECIPIGELRKRRLRAQHNCHYSQKQPGLQEVIERASVRYDSKVSYHDIHVVKPCNQGFFLFLPCSIRFSRIPDMLEGRYPKGSYAQCPEKDGCDRICRRIPLWLHGCCVWRECQYKLGTVWLTGRV